MTGRTLGLVLLGGGILILLAIVVWLTTGTFDDESGLRLSGAVFGGALLTIVIVLPMLGSGVFLYTRGRGEAAQMANVARQRRLLGIVESAGEITVADLALQLSATRDDVRADLYDLVSKGLFSGYVDWDRGVLHAAQASALRGRETCPNCGGAVSLAGKGLIRCEFCGAEIFLP